MQIRELDLKELEDAYDVVLQLRTSLSYKEFEDLIYDMRHMEYKMFGIIDSKELITYAGASIQTNLYHKRHLYVFDLVTDKRHKAQKYTQMMLDYLYDYAKMGMCENIVLSCDIGNNSMHEFCQKNDFTKENFAFFKNL